MEDDDCISQIFEYLKEEKSKPKWGIVKFRPAIVEYELKLFAHKCSGSDSWNIWNFSTYLV